MPEELRQSRFSFRQLLFALLVVVLLVGVLAPALLHYRENARRHVCASKMHEIGIALQNHRDSFKKFPQLSTEFFPQTPGADSTGFSWIARILAYMEENGLYTGASHLGSRGKIAKGGTGAFNPDVCDAARTRHYSTVQLDKLICPSFSGDPISELSGKPPYENVRGVDLSAKPAIGIGISNYVATTATSIDKVRGLVASSSDVNPCDGVIVPNKGLNRSAIDDGESKTVMACETRERSLNSWIDGSVNWVVGANPNNSASPTTDSEGHIQMPRGGTTALNVGPGSRTPDVRYLTKSNSPNGYEWSWGPSSEHAGGIVMHVYADASVREQSDSIDPPVYLRLITRAGKDPVADPGIIQEVK